MVDTYVLHWSNLGAANARKPSQNLNFPTYFYLTFKKKLDSSKFSTYIFISPHFQDGALKAFNIWGYKTPFPSVGPVLS